MNNAERLPIFVRAHTRVLNQKERTKDSDFNYGQWARYALVFDCECTIDDLRQDLTFLWWRFVELKGNRYVCLQEGIAYADNLDSKSIKLIRNYAAKLKADVEPGCPEEVLVSSRTEFVNGVFWEATRAGAALTGFNEPFDLSRLAVEYREARLKSTGWSMIFWQYPDGNENTYRPRIRIKPKDSRSAFISLSRGKPEERVIYRGRFLDLSTLGSTLRSRHMTLQGFCKSFGLPGKLEHEPTGRVTKAELDYGRRDVEQTQALLNAMKQEYDRFGLDLPPEKAMSSASITKAFLDKMVIVPPAQKFAVPDKVLGDAAQTYFGGRSEVRIRHTEMPVVVVDVTSEYPTCAALLGIWNLLTAADVLFEDCTAQVRQLLSRLTPDQLLDPKTWPQLAFFSQIQPCGDVLPVRASYTPDNVADPNIGCNPLFCEQPIWSAGPDLAGSKLLTGRVPQIIRAFRLVPVGKQSNMSPVKIGDRMFDPAHNDFVTTVIEQRKKLPKSHPHYLLLKIIANALYGVFAELNRQEYGKNQAKQIAVYSGEHEFEQSARVVELAGKWQFTPAAALITAGGRLILSLLEYLVTSQGGTYVLTDTDSMLIVASEKGGLVPCEGGPYKLDDGRSAVKALTWAQVPEIAERLNAINPYDRSVIKQILKIEDCNFDRKGNQHQLYAMAVSAKRYCVYTRKEMIKVSEHGLGAYYVPDKRKRYVPSDCVNQDDSYPMWVVEAWQYVLAQLAQASTNETAALCTSDFPFGTIPAMARIRVTTPNILAALRKRDPGCAKPYNFAMVPILLQSPNRSALVAPFNKHPERWLDEDYIEVSTGNRVRLSTDYSNKAAYVPRNLYSVLQAYATHPEWKSLPPEGYTGHPAYARGLLRRRPVHAEIPFHFIGKEVERRMQEGEDIALLEGKPIEYHKTRMLTAEQIERLKDLSLDEIQRATGLSRHTIVKARTGGKVHKNTRETLMRAAEALANS